MTFIILLTVNILFIYFIKSDKKYWLLSIPLWTILISGFIFWRISNDRQIKNLEKEYWKTTENRGWGDYDKRTKLEEAKKHVQKFNMTFVYLIGLQTLITFILQIVGQRRTTQKTYRWTKIIFGILFFFIFLLIAMMGIVPSTGYVK